MLDFTHVQFHGVPTRLRTLKAEVPAAAVVPTVPMRPRLQEPAVAGFPAAVLLRAGLSPAAYRHAPLERRVGACLRAMRAGSEESALACLDDAGLGRALSAMLIGVSSFFRDPFVFATLRGDVIPVLAARPGSIRVCSIGCSTGEELYSVAILMAEAGLLERTHLVGVDCRRDAVEFAREGRFVGPLEGVDDEVRSRYFAQGRDGWRVAEALRARTSWHVADATRDLPAGESWDLVLCRNVVIYLHSATSDGLFQRLAAALAPGGHLVVGKAERPPASLGFTAIARCVYRRS